MTHDQSLRIFICVFLAAFTYVALMLILNAKMLNVTDTAWTKNNKCLVIVFKNVVRIKVVLVAGYMKTFMTNLSIDML